MLSLLSLSSLSVASVYLLNYVKNSINQLKDFSMEISDDKVFNPGMLLNHIDPQSLEEFLKSNNFKLSNKNPAEFIRKCFVEGIIQTKYPILSYLNNITPLIYSIFF